MKTMKMILILTSVAAITLVAGIVALAQVNADRPGSEEGNAVRRTFEATKIAGKILSVSAEQVVIASEEKGQPQKVEVQLPRQAERKEQMHKLLTSGKGKQTSLLCRKGPDGGWILMRIQGIEGVEVPLFLRPRQGSDGDKTSNRPEGRAWDGPRRPTDGAELRPGFEEHRGPGEPGGPIGPGQDTFRRRPAQDPETRKLREQIRTLAEQYRTAQGPEKDRIAEQLKAALGESFDKETKTQQEMVQRMEEQLKTLKQRLQQRQQDRSKIIDRHFDRLTSDQEGQKQD